MTKNKLALVLALLTIFASGAGATTVFNFMRYQVWDAYALWGTDGKPVPGVMFVNVRDGHTQTTYTLITQDGKVVGSFKN